VSWEHHQHTVLTPQQELSQQHEKQQHRQQQHQQPGGARSGGARTVSTQLKTLEARQADRKTQGLPILAKEQEFIRQLKQDKVTIVVAATGSGKTTQLPQYAAENFDGLIVCTQPRALAAVDISKRISLEFDDCKVGENVGNAAGRRTTKGRRIMLMTDASFISMAQNDALLSKVSVLVVDEAHERSLNTDIVLGIARRVRQLRANDFHVVVASATIDPDAFVEFFGGETSVLDVPGRTHEITMEYLPGETLIPACVDALSDRPTGNLMAFLPGQREVDKAVKEFKAAAAGHFLVLPLYGGLPSEEQSLVTDWSKDKAPIGQRMIVFATNVAETSLTIPGIEIVIDTGLAKEARYDPERRTTLLEQVFVSRSSADQRKGRAGRVAPGHCIRLFADDDLVRPSIEPEILRASLDKVVLQLITLRYNPLTFEFITRPPEALLQASMDLLSEIACIQEGNCVGEYTITQRGRCFVNMDFDPRMSHFVATAAEQFGREELAAEVASILAAPGSVFFMAGKARQAAKDKIARMAAVHKSDLLLQREVYKDWSTSGAEGRQGRRARIAYAQEHGLNNRVLECVNDTVKNTLMAIRKSFNSTTARAEDTDVAVIGQCLLASFPEQLGQPLVPTDPSAGVFLLSNHSLRGTLSNTSVLVQNTEPVSLFITMSATMIPSGSLMVDSSHPIDRLWLSDELNQKVLSRVFAVDLVCSYPLSYIRFCLHRWELLR
jgi:ATP-dependent helicase HrpA